MTILNQPDAEHYYGPSAYTPGSIPCQSDQTEDPHHSPLEDRLSSRLRLPWGGTEDVIPLVVFANVAPELLRKTEQEGCKLDDRDDEFAEDRMTHERLRHVPGAFRTRFLVFTTAIARFAFFSLGPLAIITLVGIGLFDSWLSLEETLGLLFWTSGLPLLIWKVGDWLGLTFTGFWVNPGDGPKWRLSRRTGMVTVWHYPRKRWFQERETPEVFTAPFWEFDAFLYSLPDRFGVTFTLGLLHRYQKQYVSVDALIGRQSSQEPCFAFWDFLQNYMDVSKPLPELPALEKYRSQDPTTAEHDRRVGRPPRYWRDMDDDTYQAIQDEIFKENLKNTMPTRLNQMAHYVVYYHPSRKPAGEVAGVQ